MWLTPPSDFLYNQRLYLCLMIKSSLWRDIYFVTLSKPLLPHSNPWWNRTITYRFKVCLATVTIRGYIDKYNYLVLFLPAYVESCESQFGHIHLRFSNLLSWLSPFIWSKIMVKSFPFHNFSCPHISHFLSLDIFEYHLLNVVCEAVLSRQNTFS